MRTGAVLAARDRMYNIKPIITKITRAQAAIRAMFRDVLADTVGLACDSESDL